MKMAKSRKYIIAGVHGLFWAAVPALVGWLLLICSAQLAQLFASGAEEKLLQQVAGALARLKYAKFVLPWLAMLAAGALFGGARLLAGAGKAARRCFLAAEIVLFLPVTLGLLWLTQINDIQLGALVTTFWPILQEVL